ncbi:putative GPI-anchored cupredoxin [Cladobotryum mycophilum]|uniref:GPI-anchored cupredoxin n=1 Tax=Cladobotryum mycophilum TaxID=491253 RepID=A0ABR0S5Y0_9HYPO
MHFTTITTIALSALASAKTIRIDSGKDGLTFSPADIKADVGDILEWHFFPQNHSVVAADFAGPCKPAAKGGFFSSWMPTASGEGKDVFRVTVQDTKPIWFYCSQGKHCEAGMVGAVNANSNHTLVEFKAAAAKAASNESPSGGVFGGTVAAAGSTPSGTTGTNSSSPSNTSGKPSPTTNAAVSLNGMFGVAAAVVGMAVALAA